MSDRESCTHHFEHVKQTRPFTEREYMECTKCGHQNPLGLFQHWDTERDGPAGIIHHGSFTFQDYYAEATPHGTYHVWHDGEYLGEYSGQRIEIVEQLHAKGINHDR